MKSLLSRDLEAFAKVCETGTVLEASRQLKLTQTAVTQRVKSLEKHLRVSLFTRSRKGMARTQEGESLFRYCRSVKELEGAAFADLLGSSEKAIKNLAISGPSSLMRSRVIPRMTSLMKDQKNLHVRFDLTDIQTTPEKLKRGEVDLALLSPDQVRLEMDSKLLTPEKYVLVGPSQWKKRKLEDVVEAEVIIDFDPSDLFTFNFLEKYRLKSRARKDRHFANNTDALTSLVSSGVGYSVLSQEFAQGYIKRGELIDLAPGWVWDFKVALAWYPRREMPEYFQAAIKTISKNS